MQLPTLEHEKRLVSEGFLPVGVDEAGRGPLAGPVVAAAVCLQKELFTALAQNDGRQFVQKQEKEWAFVRDSKKLSPKQRERVFTLIQEHFLIGVGIVGPETIDRVNILQATFLAMKQAIGALKRITDGELRMKDQQKVLLIDGNQPIPNISLKQETIVDGDRLVKSIAAASIVAKVTRDRLIVEADQVYPGYGLAKHKGYGTREHLDALRRFGPSPIHRMSFDPVRMSLPENVNRKLAMLAKRRRS